MQAPSRGDCRQAQRGAALSRRLSLDYSASGLSAVCCCWQLSSLLLRQLVTFLRRHQALCLFVWLKRWLTWRPRRRKGVLVLGASLGFLLRGCEPLSSRFREGVTCPPFRCSLVPVSEASVVIAVSSAHRAASLGAVSYAIDALKAKVPVWKKVPGGSSRLCLPGFSQGFLSTRACAEFVRMRLPDLLTPVFLI